LEWQAEERMRCSSCGNPRDESMNPDSGIDYRAEWLLCKACETGDIATRDAQEAARKGNQPSGHRLAIIPYRLNGEVHA
jgi:hypothetical protein